MALTKLICQYTVTGFIICFIFSDQEFLPVLHHFKEATPSIDFNLANSNKHVPEAEQNNRNSQEHMCATFHSLSFHSIPAILIRYSASETVEKLNFSPEIGGVYAITVHAKSSPSSFLTMRNTVLYHNLVISRLVMSQVPELHEWHAHWIVYFFIFR